MRYTVIDKLTKKVTYPILIVSWGLVLFVVILFYANGINLWEQIISDGIWPTLFFVSIMAGLTFATIWFFWFGSTYVTINEDGIQLRIGRLILNKFAWDEIKRIEVFEEILPRTTRPILNIMSENKPSRLSQRHKNSANVHKSYFTFMYVPQALESIQKYCKCSIIGLDIANKYN